MKGLLKCYYGYRNRGDELLFFGVVKYLFDHYEDLTSLDVEVGDVDWMCQWCDMNPGLWEQYKSRVRFVSSRTFSMWVADYDMVFAGGGEVLAQKGRSSRHAGWNYLALFWCWIWTRRVVWLGGIETPIKWWSKLLYRMMLPYAREIVCREQGSYDIAKRYTDRVVLYHDFAIDILENKEEKIRVPYFKYTDGIWGIKDNTETRPRRTVQAIITNSSRDEYLLIEWEVDNLKTFVGGGVERGETELEALSKEIREEVGFDTIDIKKQIGGEIHRHFYHALKGYNNYTVTTCYLVEVDKDDQGEIAPEELEKHHPIWISQEELLSQLDAMDPDNAYFFRLYRGMDVGELEYTVSVNEYTVGLVRENRGLASVAPARPYVLINFIPKHTSLEIITQFHEWIKDYPDHQIINFPAEEGDVLPEEIVTQYRDRIQMWKWWEHDIRSSLTLFEQTQAGFGQRLHFIIPCVYYHIPIRRLAYSEKVNKILQYFDSKEL